MEPDRYGASASVGPCVPYICHEISDCGISFTDLTVIPFQGREKEEEKKKEKEKLQRKISDGSNLDLDKARIW